MSILGAEFVEQNPIPVWRQGIGWTSEYAMEGIRAQVDAVATSYAGAEGVIEIRYQELGGGLWRATIAFAGKTREEAQDPPSPDSQVETTWAFPRNDLQREIWQHPRIEEQLRNMSSVYRARFRADVEKWMAGEVTVDSPDGSGGTTEMTLSAEALKAAAAQFGANPAEIQMFLDTLTEGQTTYIESRRVLRLTRIGPTRGEWYKANTFTNRCFTRARLVADLNPPDWVAHKMPAGFWFKHEPEESQGGQKIEMMQEFEYFGTRFSTYTYGAAIT